MFFDRWMHILYLSEAAALPTLHRGVIGVNLLYLKYHTVL